MGNVCTMARECSTKKSGQIDYRADLFSLGATLRMLCTGREDLDGKFPHQRRMKRRQEKAKLTRANCVIKNAKDDDIEALSEAVVALLGSRGGRAEYFENIWTEKIFEKANADAQADRFANSKSISVEK